MHWVTPGIRDAFDLVEEALRETFLSDLFQGLGERAPGRGVTRLSVKQAGLALTDLIKTASENRIASCVIKGHLVVALKGQVDFRNADHSSCLQEGQTALQNWSVLRAEESLAETIAGAPVQGARQLQCATKMRA